MQLENPLSLYLPTNHITPPFNREVTMKKGIIALWICLLVGVLPLNAIAQGNGYQALDSRNFILTITPLSTQVPYYGGMASFIATVHSTTADTADLWFDLGIPDGQQIGPYYIWHNMTFAAGQNRVKNVHLYCSPQWQSGTYKFRVRIGTWGLPGGIELQDSLAFTKATLGGNAVAPAPAYKEGTMIVTDAAAPAALDLTGLAPQPCNPEVEISYTVLNPGEVTLSLYNVLGRCLITRIIEAPISGAYKVVLPTSEYASGTYFLRLEMAGTSIQQPLTIIK
jgi:hypothetical protein